MADKPASAGSLANLLQIARRQVKKQENILESVFKVLPDLFFLIDAKGFIRDYRARNESDLFVSPDIFVNKNISTVLPKSIGKLFFRAIEENIHSGKVVSFEYDLPYQEGIRRFECRLNQLTDASLFTAVVRNITEPHNAAEALADSEARYRGLLENAPFPIIISRVSDRTLRYANVRAKADFGWEDGTGIGLPTAQFYTSADDQKQFFEKLRRDGYVNDSELLLLDGKDEPYWALISATIVEFEKDPAIMISINNINARKAAELALHQERAKLFARVNEQKCLQKIFTITDNDDAPLDTLMEQVIFAMQQGWQYPDITSIKIMYDGLIYHTANYLDTPWMLTSENLTETGDAVTLSVAYREERPDEDEGPFFKEEHILLDTILSRLTDIINRRHTTQIIAEQDDLVRIMFDQTTDGIVLIDTKTRRFFSFNTRAYEELGYTRTEFAKLTMNDIQASYSDAEVEEILSSVAAGASTTFDTLHLTKSGEMRNVTVSLSSLHHGGFQLACASWRDITEIKKQEHARQLLTEQLQLHTRLIREISAMPSGMDGQVDTYAEEITELLGKELGIDRVSVWTFQQDNDPSVCTHLFDQTSGRHPEDTHFQYAFNSNTLEILKSTRYIDAADAQNDARTKDLATDYLVPLNIRSLLDCSIVSGGGSNGVLRFEYIGRLHVWQPSEISFCCEVADQIGMACLNRSRLASAEALRQSESFLKKAQSVSKTGHWYLNIERDILFCSEETCRIFGIEYDSPHTLATFFNLAHPDDLPHIQEDFRRALSGEPFRTAYRILVNGELKWVEKRAEIEFDANNRPSICLGTVQDITAMVNSAQELDLYRHHLEEMVRLRTSELETAKAAAESANLAKSSFLSNMSHEIRTPINAIIGFAYLIRREPLTRHQADELDKLSASSRHLLQIINDILDLSKIEARKVTLDIYDFEPARIIAGICSLVEEDAAKKDLRISVDLDRIPRSLSGDGNRVSQILLNLLTNAVKFTEKGSISITARVLAKIGEKITLQFSVQDTGIGITPEQLSRLFIDFEQATNSTTRYYGGTGLGLSISKKLTELMGGTISVESEFGLGSTFSVTIPFAASHISPESPYSHIPLSGSDEVLMNASADDPGMSAESVLKELQKYQGAKILLAEDNPINQEVAKGLLESVRLDVSTAENGQEAVTLVASSAYDLILMDIQMPVMDGLEAARLIRALPDRQSVPIVAMTAVAFEEDRVACLKAGMNDYLGKPVDPDVLYRTILKWLPARDIMSALQMIEGLDAAFGLKNLAGNIPWYCKMLVQFITRHTEDAAVMKDCLKEDDLPAIQKLCHSLKGTSSTLGFTAIQEQAIEIENMIRSGQPPEKIEPDILRLDTALCTTAEELRRVLDTF